MTSSASHQASKDDPPHPEGVIATLTKASDFRPQSTAPLTVATLQGFCRSLGLAGFKLPRTVAALVPAVDSLGKDMGLNRDRGVASTGGGGEAATGVGITLVTLPASGSAIALPVNASGKVLKAALRERLIRVIQESLQNGNQGQNNTNSGVIGMTKSKHHISKL